MSPASYLTAPPRGVSESLAPELPRSTPCDPTALVALRLDRARRLCGSRGRVARLRDRPGARRLAHLPPLPASHRRWARRGDAPDRARGETTGDGRRERP